MFSSPSSAKAAETRELETSRVLHQSVTWSQHDELHIARGVGRAGVALTATTSVVRLVRGAVGRGGGGARWMEGGVNGGGQAGVRAATTRAAAALIPG
jgi:hypothetical protein